MGREFLDIFTDWADTYDDSVAGDDPQYAAVFANYDDILTEVVRHASGTVVEFGVGTGNLAAKLLEKGSEVVGVEPSNEMRSIAAAKLPELTVQEGDFLDYPSLPADVETIVSTYAFHHLTDEEKDLAIKQFSGLLPTEGKIIFGDTIFQSEAHKQKAIDDAKKKGFTDLAEDLEREYYTTIPVIQTIFNTHKFDVTFKQMNDFVWLIKAERMK
ncbi:class I SAM-dependent DNA methyltransferase [Oceanobacillus picturae]|jgi:putative AdoMet-dependent methyltransferase|uniref:class I SAM-dependent DNA methyltransferase n=1 Tax=Oceanobacillus picturae TaxID=171693 RepID=UPI000E68CDC2|nr:class I SAM-dependent methyltransferase [Oceanobacillus picturae]RIU90623.1 class I SAM-dependent methyltransferase [Oceanobacillus picturae]